MDVDNIRTCLPQEARKRSSRKLVVNAGKKSWNFSQPRLFDLRAGPTESPDSYPPRLQQLNQAINDDLFATNTAIRIMYDRYLYFE